MRLRGFRAFFFYLRRRPLRGARSLSFDGYLPGKPRGRRWCDSILISALRIPLRRGRISQCVWKRLTLSSYGLFRKEAGGEGPHYRSCVSASAQLLVMENFVYLRESNAVPNLGLVGMMRFSGSAESPTCMVHFGCGGISLELHGGDLARLMELLRSISKLSRSICSGHIPSIRSLPRK